MVAQNYFSINKFWKSGVSQQSLLAHKKILDQGGTAKEEIQKRYHGCLFCGEKRSWKSLVAGGDRKSMHLWSKYSLHTDFAKE